MIWVRVTATLVAVAGIVSMVGLSGPIVACLGPILDGEARSASCAAGAFLADPTAYLLVVLGVAPFAAVAAAMVAIAVGTRSATDAVRVGVAGAIGAVVGTLAWALMHAQFPVLFPSRIAFVFGGSAALAASVWWGRRQHVASRELT